MRVYRDCDTKLCAKNEKTHLNSIYIVDIYIADIYIVVACKVNEWCSVDCFHCEIRVFNQIMMKRKQKRN